MCGSYSSPTALSVEAREGGEFIVRSVCINHDSEAIVRLPSDLLLSVVWGITNIFFFSRKHPIFPGSEWPCIWGSASQGHQHHREIGTHL